MEPPYTLFEADVTSLQDLLDEADAAVATMKSHAPRSEQERASLASYDEDFLVRSTYNSAAIEGSTLSLGDTALVIEGEFLPADASNKRLSDVFAAKGIADAWVWASGELAAQRPLSEELIKDIHQRLALDCQPRARGSYRTGPVFIKGSMTTPVSAVRVREAMADLIFAFDSSRLPVIAKAAALHAVFENIHPFADGNGRVGRVLLNYVLMSEGYPPIAIKADMRGSYAEALESWQVRGAAELFIASVCESVLAEAQTRTDIIRECRSCG